MSYLGTRTTEFFHLFVSGFYTHEPSQQFDRGTLALRNYEDLLGFLFRFSAGASCFSLSPGLGQLQFRPELQLSATGWNGWFHLGAHERKNDRPW